MGIVAPGGVLFIYLFYLTHTCIREEAGVGCRSVGWGSGGGLGIGGRVVELPVKECVPLLIPDPNVASLTSVSLASETLT